MAASLGLIYVTSSDKAGRMVQYMAISRVTRLSKISIEFSYPTIFYKVQTIYYIISHCLLFGNNLGFKFVCIKVRMSCVYFCVSLSACIKIIPVINIVVLSVNPHYPPITNTGNSQYPHNYHVKNNNIT